VRGSISRRRRTPRPRDAQFRHERELRLAGFQRIAGIDEVGRGCLAGPVVAAAVILPPRPRLRGLRDSKVVPRLRREQLYELILDRADAIGVGCVEVDVIDRINILQATKLKTKVRTRTIAIAAMKGMPQSQSKYRCSGPFRRVSSVAQ
jgi:hypothetical protein